MFNNIGPMGLVVIAVIVLVLFGRGKISSLMGEVGKGITSFKKGVTEGKAEIEAAAAEEAIDVTPAPKAAAPKVAAAPKAKAAAAAKPKAKAKAKKS